MLLANILTKKLAAIVAIGFAMLGIVVLLKSPLLTSLIGLTILSPIQIRILNGQDNPGVWQYAKETFTIKNFSYTIGFIITILFPGMLVGLVTMGFPSPVNKVLFLVIFPPIFSFAYVKLAPILHETATGVRGVPMKGSDMAMITGAIFIFGCIPHALEMVVSPGTTIAGLVSILSFFASIALVCLFAAVVYVRNMPVEEEQGRPE